MGCTEVRKIDPNIAKEASLVSTYIDDKSQAQLTKIWKEQNMQMSRLIMKITTSARPVPMASVAYVLHLQEIPQSPQYHRWEGHSGYNWTEGTGILVSGQAKTLSPTSASCRTIAKYYSRDRSGIVEDQPIAVSWDRAE